MLSKERNDAVHGHMDSEQHREHEADDLCGDLRLQFREFRACGKDSKQFRSSPLLQRARTEFLQKTVSLAHSLAGPYEEAAHKCLDLIFI
jgi:hypothetical protein